MTVIADATLQRTADPVLITGRLGDGRAFVYEARHDVARLTAVILAPDGTEHLAGGRAVVTRDVEFCGFLPALDSYDLAADLAAELPELPPTPEGTNT